jgi:probable phosphoglycerate mutase
MKIYVTRHGETDYNVAGRFTGSTDVPLNDKGKAQAAELAERLQGMTFDAVISSPMLRARQTADIVCAALGMEYETCEHFVEINMGAYEGLTRDEARERYPELWNSFAAGNRDSAPDGGETRREACARVDNGMKLLTREYYGKTLLLICHGYTARAIHRYCLNLSLDEASSFSLDNCDVVSYTVRAVE